ncbi:carbohydrate kinase family protein [Candidatus Woesearchaeota archaeon]|jgi:sugar/nucleoside kinase (ribokinase family)|nr:carbohydrate kinase family protein [Candidatus Woesearchaeota archaeon]
MVDVICLGHLTRDKIQFYDRKLERRGGPAYFISQALADQKILPGIVSVVDENFNKSLYGVDTEGIKVVDTMTTVEITEDEKGVRGHISLYGPTIDSSSIPKIYLDANIAVVSTVKDEVPLHLIQSLSDRGMIIALDLQGYLRTTNGKEEAITAAVMADYIKITESELEKLTSEETLEKRILQLNSEVNAEAIAVTRGRKGVSLYHEGDIISLETVAVNGVQTAGAGDLFFGHLIGRIKQGESFKEAASQAQWYVFSKLEQRLAKLNEVKK